MKKSILILISLLIVTTGFAQFSVGPRIGVNFSTVSGKDFWGGDYKHKWITGLVVGAVGEYPFSDMISLDAEILYITSGAKYIYKLDEGDRAVGQDEGYWKETYGNLQIPILAKFNFGDEIQFYGNLGPYFSLVLCGKYKDVVDVYNYEQKGKIKFKDEPDNYEGDDWYLNSDNYHTYDIGMYIGAGAKKQLGPGVLSFDARFGLGFIDWNKFKNKDDKPNDYKAYHNRNISISFAYTIDFGDDNAMRYFK
jgi:hypothetical protein